MMKPFVISLVVLLIGGTLGNLFRYTEQTPDRAVELTTIPLEAGPYHGTEASFAQATLEVLNATDTRMVQYDTPSGSSIGLFVAYFASQRFGSSVHSPKHCLPGGGWRIKTIEAYEIDVAAGMPIKANRMQIAYGKTENVMLYWYQTRSGVVRDEFGLKYSLFKNSLLMRPTDAAMVRVTVPVTGGDYESATRRAVQFLAVFEPHIRRALPF